MARMPRFTPVGFPYHVIQRGNNRQVIFNGDEDCAAYMSWLKEYADKYDVSIHAWVLMTNHVHLVVSPKHEDGISKMMQSLGRMYVRYYNSTYHRTGTLWEGRFKSCLIADNEYFLGCCRYVELNPVRAGMVEDPAQFKWSSYQSNALGLKSRILNPHEVYLSLGQSPEERQENYRKMFESEIEESMVSDIREATQKGLAIGNERFKREIELNLGRRVTAGKMGRPRKEKMVL